MFENKNSDGFGGYLKPLLIGLLFSLLVTAVFLFIFAAMLTFYDASDSIITIMSMLALGVGAFIGGIVTAKAYGKNGLILGFFSGILLFFIITVIAMIVNSSGLTIQSFIKLVLSIVCACIGGVMGINIKRKRKLI